MRNSFKPALIIGAALAMGLTGCSKEDGGTETNFDAKTVVFSFSQEGQLTGTRGAGSHVADQSAVTVNDAYIYFTDASDNIVDYVQIVTTGAGAADTYDATAKTVGMTPARTTGGTPITGVKGTTQKVYVVANYPGGTYPTTGNVVALVDAITVESQTKTDNGVGKVTVYGGNGLTVTDATNNKYYSKVSIKPIAARMEIGRITGKRSVADVGIKSFTLKGIYMNRYYTTFGGTTLVNNGTDKTKYNAAVSGSAYTALDEILSDYTAANLVEQGNGRLYAPVSSATATDVWAYNLVAPEAATAKMSSIVICISDVVVTDDLGVDDAVTYAGDKFLTVRNIYKSGAPTTALAKLERGWVYRILDLQFSETDLTGNPEQNLVDVTVEVDILPWEAADVNYDFN